jgi:HK97 family phage portal protein
MSFWSRLLGTQERASYDRSSGNMLVNEPQFMWLGHDSGGGRYPIGPNGPFHTECLPAITRLTAIIVDPLASSPWTVAESTTGLPRAGAVMAPPRWMTDPQLLRPDDRYPIVALPAVRRMSRSAFWATWIRSAVWLGAGFLLFSEDATGAPIPGSLRVLHPGSVKTVRNEFGTAVWEIGDGPDTVQTDRDGYLLMPGNMRLVVLRDPHGEVDAEGRTIGTFERNHSTFGLADRIDNYAGNIFHSGVPSGFLKVTAPGLDADKARTIRAAWMSAHGGDKRSVAVLNATTDFKPIQFSPVDMALIEGKRANLADMAMAFGLDPGGALGLSMGGTMTYANAQSQFARLRQDLMPWIVAVEQTLGALLPSGRDMRIDFSDLTRPDPTQQIPTIVAGLEAGLLSVDEGRAQLGLPPMEGAAGGADEARRLAAAEVIQKVYLGVGTVITSDEARQLVNEAGGTLAVPGPEFAPAPPTGF